LWEIIDASNDGLVCRNVEFEPNLFIICGFIPPHPLSTSNGCLTAIGATNKVEFELVEE
jgi:hypothetical protein